MAKIVSVAACSLALALLTASVFLFLEWRDASCQAAILSSLNEQSGKDLEALRAEIASLKSDLDASRGRAQSLGEKLGDAERRAAQAAAELAGAQAADAEAEKAEAPEPKRKPGQPYLLSSIEDADRLAAEILAKGDIEALWLLGADLLALGTPGYEKIVELLAELGKDNERFEHIGQLWNRPEMFIGPFLRAVATHDEDLLKFGLFLGSKTAEELPPPLRDMRRELDDELGPILLGFYDGGDPEILDGYTEWYRGQIDAKVAAGEDVDDEIQGLGQIPTPAAERIILDILPRTEGRAREAAVRALAWRRSEAAVPILQSLLETTQDARLRALLGAALRYLQ